MGNKLHNRANHHEAEVLCSQGKTIGEAVRQIGVTEQPDYRWWKKYSGMSPVEARKYKELEKENARLKRLAADLSLDKVILQDVRYKEFSGLPIGKKPRSICWRNIRSVNVACAKD